MSCLKASERLDTAVSNIPGWKSSALLFSVVLISENCWLVLPHRMSLLKTSETLLNNLQSLYNSPMSHKKSMADDLCYLLP